MEHFPTPFAGADRKLPVGSCGVNETPLHFSPDRGTNSNHSSSRSSPTRLAQGGPPALSGWLTDTRLLLCCIQQPLQCLARLGAVETFHSRGVLHRLLPLRGRTPDRAAPTIHAQATCQERHHEGNINPQSASAWFHAD